MKRKIKSLFAHVLYIFCSRRGTHNFSGKRRGYGSLFASYPDLVDVDTLCEMLGGISKKLAYRLLSSGEIGAIKIGRTYKIPKLAVTEYLIGNLPSLRSTSADLCGNVCVADSKESKSL